MSSQFDSIMESLQDTLEYVQGNDSKCRAVEVGLDRKTLNEKEHGKQIFSKKQIVD